MIHIGLVASSMMFGLVVFVKTKLHQISCMIRSAIHGAMTRLSFVGVVGRLGGGMWLQGVDQLVSWYAIMKSLVWQHFTSPVTTLETRRG